MKKEKRRDRKCRSTTLIALLVALLIGAFLIGLAAIQSIRANVRSTTIKVIQEITNSKSLMLSVILEESEQDLRSLAVSLDASRDNISSKKLLQNFDKENTLGGLTIIDREGHALYGTEDACLLKGIPAGFAQQVMEKGFAMSDTLIGVDGDRRMLFGTVLAGGQILYANITTDSLQKAFGETTYLGEGYSYILGQGGKILIPPVRYSYEQVYDNIRYLLDKDNNSLVKIDGFIEALDSGATGSVVFSINSQEQLFCFEPVQEERGWQLVTVVALNAVEKDGARIIRAAMGMAAIIVGVIILALVAGSVFYWSMLRRQQENDRFLLSIYQAISENTDTVIFILNDKSRPDYVFENSGRILGIPADEFLQYESGQNQNSAFRKELQALLEEPWPQKGCTQEVHTYNDRLHRDMWLKVLICPFLLGDERKCIYAVTDVTQEHNDREKIAAAVVVAEQANAAKSNFFSNMSHDMRTPMNGIVGMTAIAKQCLDNRDRVLDCLNKIELSSRHLVNLINDVLDMSKIESGKLALVSRPFDLTDLLRGLESILRPQCEAKHQSLAFMMDIKHSEVLGDSLRLNQIFMNLLSNAVKFTQEGGTITFSLQEREQRAGSATYRFTVTDNGIGMEPETQRIIFNPFERAPNAAVHQIEGTGLGLAITKNLITVMGGQITLESSPGRGSSFLVDLELPLQENIEQEIHATEGVVLNENSLMNRRILLAEDNEINQEIAVELLTAHGAAVDVVDNGKLALERFTASAPGYYDAILMDIQMPVMNGYEAAREIRASSHPQAKGILIVALTANVFAEDVLAARNAGMDAHIAKPIDLEYLYRVLKEKLPPVQ